MDEQTPPQPTPQPQNPPTIKTLEDAINKAKTLTEQPQPTPTPTPTPQPGQTSSPTSNDADALNQKLTEAQKLNEQYAADIARLNANERKLLEENNKLYNKVLALIGGKSSDPTPQPTPTPTPQPKPNKSLDFVNKLKGGY